MTDIPDDIKPIEFMVPIRFKLSFNKVGNCTSMHNYADKLFGEWVWLVNAENGKNCPLYTEEALQQAILAERNRCASIADKEAEKWKPQKRKFPPWDNLGAHCSGRIESANRIAVFIRASD